MQGNDLGHFMAKSQYRGGPSKKNYVKGKNEEDVEKDIVISTFDMFMDKGISHGLERDSKVHGNVR